MELEPGRHRRSPAATGRARRTWSRPSSTWPRSARTGSRVRRAADPGRGRRGRSCGRASRPAWTTRARCCSRSRSTPGRANRASLNRGPLKRPRDLLGALRVVLFSPEDLALVKGDPTDRRRFLDDLVTPRWPRMAGVRADYDRVLRQRSTLLKSLVRTPRAAGRGRRRHPRHLGRPARRAGRGARRRPGWRRCSTWPSDVADAYRAIAPTNNDAAGRLPLVRRSRARPTGRRRPRSLGRDRCERAASSAMAERRGEEIARGVSLVGSAPRRPRADAGGAARPRATPPTASRWSFALALRLAPLRAAARRRRRAGADPRRRLRRARRGAPRAARRADRRRRAGADHRGRGRRTCPAALAGRRGSSSTRGR